MPQRFSQGLYTIIALIGAGGGIITYLSVAPGFIGLTATLNIFNSFLLGLVLLMLWLLHKDLEAMDDSETAGSEDESSESNQTPPAISEGEDIRTDGGIVLSPVLRELQEESPEGGGALAGLIAGGAIGLLGGPLGVVLGGIAGGFLGNEAEYQQIVNRYRDELGRTAENALDREPVVAPRPYTLKNISHRSSDDSYAVLIEDSMGQRHRIRLNLNEQIYNYEEA